MQYLEMFDEEFIDSVEKWVRDNNADVSQITELSSDDFSKLSKQEYLNADVQ